MFSIQSRTPIVAWRQGAGAPYVPPPVGTSSRRGWRVYGRGQWQVFTGGAIAPPTPGTTGAVVYLPLRVVSGRWSETGVTASEDLSNTIKWLPPARQPVGWVTIGGQRYPVQIDSAWFGFHQTVAETKLGGVNAATVPDVVTAVEGTLTESAAASATVAAVAQQTQANADSLAATVSVVQANSLVGANTIPRPQTTMETP